MKIDLHKIPVDRDNLQSVWVSQPRYSTKPEVAADHASLRLQKKKKLFEHFHFKAGSVTLEGA